MKNGMYILRLTLILLVITVVVAGLLGLVNFLTEDRIAENTAGKARAAMAEVLPADSYTPMEVPQDALDRGITEAYSAGDAGCVVRLRASGFGGAIDMMVGVDPQGAVTGLSIVSHSETASLGANCTRPRFRDQFRGQTGPLAVSKDGGTVDALTGATVTSRAVTSAVNVALDFAKEVSGQ